MKIRSGFVSNSSSASFLIVLDKRPTLPIELMSKGASLEEAELLLTWMKRQKGILLCNPPQPECDSCKERFKCFTGNGKRSELARLIRTGGWRYDDETEADAYKWDYEWEWDSEYMEKCIERAERLLVNFPGKVVYCFRIGDYGEGCSGDVEAEMRDGRWCRNMYHEEWQ